MTLSRNLSKLASTITPSNGNIGIGTSSPDRKLSLYTTDATGKIALFSNGYTNTNLYLSSDASSAGGIINVSNNAASAAVPLIFQGNGSERMRIDSSGNVGIGTSSPGAKLDVVGSVKLGVNNASWNIDHYTNVNWNYSNLNLWRNASNTATPRFLSFMLDGDSNTSTTIGGYNAIWGAYDSAPTTGSTSSALNGAMVYGAYAGHRWYTNGTERMRIDSSGNLLVNANTVIGSDGAKLHVAGNACIATSTATTALTAAVGFHNPNGRVGYIGVSGTTTSYVTSSDYRLKENIQPMQNALGVVAQLNPVTYTWKADGSDGQGFIAHELQAVVPDCVTGEKDAVDAEGNPVYQGIDTSFLVATLTKAIQELEARVKELESK